MQDEPWHVKRLRELEAAAPVKRKKVEPFRKGSVVVDCARDQGHQYRQSAGVYRAASRRLEGQAPNISAAQRSTGQAWSTSAHEISGPVRPRAGWAHYH
jgi:hypothetical protein